MKNVKYMAVVLSGGVGKRAGANVPKQYVEVNGYPILYYTLKAFEESMAEAIVVVAAHDYIEYVRNDIVEKYGFKKVKAIVAGGNERYDSVYRGLKAYEAMYVAVHDGARPYVTPEIINKSFECAKEYKACVAAVPSKDTVKLVSDGICTSTPDRKNVWIIQTPQTFDYEVLLDAYERQQALGDVNITDDAMVVEKYSDTSVHVFESSYTNIKITTPDDIELAKHMLRV